MTPYLSSNKMSCFCCGCRGRIERKITKVTSQHENCGDANVSLDKIMTNVVTPEYNTDALAVTNV